MALKTWAMAATMAATACVGSLASAASISYYFGGDGSGAAGNQWFGSDQGVDLTVTPGSFIVNTAGIAGVQSTSGPIVGGTSLGSNGFDANAQLVQEFMGLGVNNNSVAGTDDNPTRVDGSGWRDFLVLEFSEAVQLDFANLSMFGAGDSFSLLYDLNNNGILGDDGDFLSDGISQANYTGFPSVPTSLIGFATNSSSDGWQLLNVGASTIDDNTPPPAPVPLPAGGLLLVAGLGGLAAMRRTKR